MRQLAAPTTARRQAGVRTREPAEKALLAEAFQEPAASRMKQERRTKEATRKAANHLKVGTAVKRRSPRVVKGAPRATEPQRATEVLAVSESCCP